MWSQLSSIVAIFMYLFCLNDVLASAIPVSMQPFASLQSFEEFQTVLDSFPKIYELELSESHGQNGDLVSTENPLIIAGMKIAGGWVNVRYFKDNSEKRSFEISATDENGVLRPFYFADPLPHANGKSVVRARRGRRTRAKLFSANRLGNCFAGCHSPSTQETEAKNADTPYGMILPVILASKDAWARSPGMSATAKSPSSLPQTANLMQLHNIRTFAKHLENNAVFQKKKRLFRLALLNCDSWQEESKAFAGERLKELEASVFLKNSKTFYKADAALDDPLPFRAGQQGLSPDKVRWVSVNQVWSDFNKLFAFVVNSSRAFSMDFDLPSGFEETQRQNHQIYTKMLLTAGNPDLFLILSHVGGASAKKPMLLPDFHFNFQQQLVETFSQVLNIPEDWQGLSQVDLCQ